MYKITVAVLPAAKENTGFSFAAPARKKRDFPDSIVADFEAENFVEFYKVFLES